MMSKIHILFHLRLGLLLGLFSLCACNIPRDNPLDPKNPDSKQPQKVLIQAFVNTNNTASYNEYMLEALYQLQNEYDGQLVVAAHHRNTADSESPYHCVENELLYQTYLSGFDSPIKGVPDVFFNGTEGRVQGASSLSTALLRLQEALTDALKSDSYFLIDADYRKTGSGVKPEVTIARLGDRHSESILVKCMILSTIDSDHRNVVTDQNQSRLIDTLKHGESVDVELDELTCTNALGSILVVYITNKNEQTVYQCESIPL